jgi:hypothetical protein
VVDVVEDAGEVQQLVALLHELVDSRAVLLGLGVVVAGAVDEFVDDVVQPEEVGVGFVACEVVPRARDN